MLDELKENKKDINLNKLIRNDFGIGTKYDIPIIKKIDIEDLNLEFMSFKNIKVKTFDYANVNKTIHFFIDDHNFEKVYSNPLKYCKALAKYKYILSPDFSLYSSMPYPIQLHNVFKNRWCGAYWQRFGLRVIPTISWSTKESYSFCFTGVEKGAIVAVSTLACKKSKEQFLEGYNMMLEVIEPSLIYCYDKPFREMKGNIIYIGHWSTDRRY